MEKSNKNSGIYMILNIMSMKVYIGSSSNLSRRRSKHYRSLRKGKHHNKHLQNSFDKYGENRFKFFVLTSGVPREDLFKMEAKCIKHYDSLNRDKGYNLAVPHADGNLVERPEVTEAKRRAMYEHHNGPIADEVAYEEWRLERIEYKNKPKLTREEDIKRKIKDLGRPLYGICKRTNEILHDFPSVRALVKFCNSRSVYQYIDKENTFLKNMAIVSHEKYDSTKDYRKKYSEKSSTYIKRGKWKGNSVETFNKETEDVIKVYDNLYDLAEDLGSSRKYLRKVIKKEKGNGYYKGIGIRWSEE